MNLIKRHIPGFVDHEPEDLIEIEFETLQQLLDIEFVKRWDTPRLERYTVGREPSSVVRTPLMAEMVDGGFWVLGFLKEDMPELPSWDKSVCDARKLANKTNV